MKFRRLLPVLSALVGLTAVTGCQLIPIFWAAADTPDNQVSVRRQAAPLVSNNSGSLVSNNSGSLGGKVLAPASLISNNAGGLISNNAGGIISNNAAGFRVAALTELPVAKARVDLVDRDGKTVATTATDNTGTYAFTGLSTDHVYVVQVTFTVGTQNYQEMAIAKPAPTKVDVPVTTATTLVVAKVVAQAGQTAIEKLDLVKVQVTVTTVAQAESDATTTPTVLTNPTQSAKAFDTIAKTNTQVGQNMQDTLNSATATPTPSPTSGPISGGVSS